jgi:hypothetical protein
MNTWFDNDGKTCADVSQMFSCKKDVFVHVNCCYITQPLTSVINLLEFKLNKQIF